MLSVKNLKTWLSGAALCSMCAMNASEPVTFSFERSGTTANDVSVIVTGVEGVTATVTNISHSLKSLSNSAILCPDINGNTSPNIEIALSVTGLPSDMVFNTAGLHIHALNSTGAYQQNNDLKTREWNVSVLINDDEFAFYNNIDIAANVPDCHMVWEQAADAEITATSPLTLTVQISADAATNVGCFFGLETIILSNADSVGPDPEPDPDPEPEPEPDTTNSKIYTIKWKNNTSSYMTEQADGSIAIGEYGTFNKVFWEFIPTDKDNCFYIRNTATGNYIGSCNKTPGSSSKVYMTTTPVEYYVHLSAATSGENSGCYWMSSTDCTGYDNESSSARCLNKDGASSSIITWKTGVANIGSYWTLTETEDLYEIKPFTSSAAIGECQAAYHIMNPSGEAYSVNGNWVPFDVTAKSQQWYFVGVSNAAGGYQIVNLESNQVLNNGAQYTVAAKNGTAPYNFLDAEGNALEFAAITDITFVAARSAFAMNNQLYKMPCGTTGEVYIRKATIGSEFNYPMGKYQNKKIVYSSASVPTNKYVILSRDMADVTPAQESALTLTLNRAPGNYKVYAYFDWNRDGHFETTQELEFVEKEVATTFNVPADAVSGKTRARIRVTDNGLSEADDDTHGQVLDLLLYVADMSEEPIAPIVKVNAVDRGTAVWENNTAVATPKGNATFLYWAENHRIVSVDAAFAVEAGAKQRILTAFFTPKTEEMDGIDDIILSETDSKANIICQDCIISVNTDADVLAIVVFATNGTKIAGTTENKLSVSGVVPGVYIVKAVTSNGVASAKFKL